jgi:ABC-type sugar transport system permease subunit
MSFTSWAGVGSPQWAGLSSWRSALEDGGVFGSLEVSIVVAAVAAGLTTAVSLMLGLLVHWRTPGWKFFRFIWFLPALVPASAAGSYWDTALQPNFGFINGLLGAVGLGDAHSWLASPFWAQFAVSGVWVWGSSAFAFLFILGGLQQIPQDVQEAATVDGAASQWLQLRFMILPIIRPVLGVVLALQFIWAFNGFALVYSMTQGGPGTSTEIIPLDVYNQAFTNFNFGGAAAVAVLGSAVLFIIGAGLLRSSRSLTRE